MQNRHKGMAHFLWPLYFLTHLLSGSEAIVLHLGRSLGA